MEDMQRSTFHTSTIERDRRRTDGPRLTLVHGGVRTASTPHEIPGWHPASEDFTPADAAGAARLRVVRDSEPGSPILRSTSRGGTTPDSEAMAAPGSGPIPTRDELLERIARFLEATAGEASVPNPSEQIRQIR
jgi:hypothetical protein